VSSAKTGSRMGRRAHVAKRRGRKYIIVDGIIMFSFLRGFYMIISFMNDFNCTFGCVFNSKRDIYFQDLLLLLLMTSSILSCAVLHVG